MNSASSNQPKMVLGTIWREQKFGKSDV